VSSTRVILFNPVKVKVVRIVVPVKAETSKLSEVAKASPVGKLSIPKPAS